jgi:O-antigen/teichoic acid export membrane protein
LIEYLWPDLRQYRAIAMVMGLMIPLSLMIFFFQQGLRGFHEIRYMVMGSSFLQLTAKVIITVIVFALGWRLGGYVLAVVVSTFIGIVWMAIGLRRILRSLPVDVDSAAHDRSSELAWRRYAGVQYSSSLIGLGSGYLDRFLLAIFASASSVGVLAVVKQLQQLPGVFLQMFIAVAAPMFSAVHARQDDGGRQHLYGLATDWLVKAAAPLLIFLAIYARPTLGLFGDEFARDGATPLRILLVSQAVNVAAGPVGTILNMSGHETRALRINIVQTFLTIGLLVSLTPTFGLTGIAVAMAVSVVYSNAGSLYVARRSLGLRWLDPRYRKWILPIALTVLACLFGRYIVSEKGALALAATLLIAYGVFYAAVFAQGLHEDDKELLREVAYVFGRLDRRVARASDD